MSSVDHRVSCLYNICLVNNYKSIEHWIHPSVYILVYLSGKDDTSRFVHILITEIPVNIRPSNLQPKRALPGVSRKQNIKLLLWVTQICQFVTNLTWAIGHLLDKKKPVALTIWMQTVFFLKLVLICYNSICVYRQFSQ